MFCYVLLMCAGLHYCRRRCLLTLLRGTMSYSDMLCICASAGLRKQESSGCQKIQGKIMFWDVLTVKYLDRKGLGRFWQQNTKKNKFFGGVDSTIQGNPSLPYHRAARRSAAGLTNLSWTLGPPGENTYQKPGGGLEHDNDNESENGKSTFEKLLAYIGGESLLLRSSVGIVCI